MTVPVGVKVRPSGLTVAVSNAERPGGHRSPPTAALVAASNTVVAVAWCPR